MAELLLELFSEEIPARMQAKAEADLLAALTARLKEAGLGWKAAFAVSGPRRLTAVIEGLDARSADVREEKKGPKVGAPQQAIDGFLRGAGLTSIDQASIVSDPKKGDSYVAYQTVPGRDAVDVIAEAVPAIVRGFSWPKSMRTAGGDLRWVRPLQRILCVLDGVIVPFEVGGVVSGNVTEGHRVHGRGPYTVKGWKDYKKALEGKGHVILSRADRRARILEGIADVCGKAGLELVPDEGLLEEVTGLAEWPVVVLGQMEPSFLDLPPEVIKLSMRTHQKYFAVRRPGTDGLAPNFIVVANLTASDGGVKIAEGNSRVLSARLSDARFFWEKDKATPLEVMGQKLSTIAFKEELGSLGYKTLRVASLAKGIGKYIGIDEGLVERAAWLSKVDLVSEMVGEFPELQGTMGRYYSIEAGEDLRVADAIRDHYKPQGPNDALPTDLISAVVALADKLDTLTGFWRIGDKPTGSKDPFALRRAALGVVRIILELQVRLPLISPIWFGIVSNDRAVLVHQVVTISDENARLEAQNKRTQLVSAFDLQNSNRDIARQFLATNAKPSSPIQFENENSLSDSQSKRLKEHENEVLWPAVADLLSFFADRLKQVLRDQGKRHDLIDAVFALGEDDLVLIVKRVEALGAFLETEDGATLLAGYKRAANILKAEEKKGALPETLSVDGALVAKGPAVEQALWAAVQGATASLEAPLAAEDFAGAMRVLAGLRGPVDAFFEGVMVNDPDAAVRANRLALLAEVRGALHKVADFSKIEG